MKGHTITKTTIINVRRCGYKESSILTIAGSILSLPAELPRHVDPLGVVLAHLGREDVCDGVVPVEAQRLRGLRLWLQLLCQLQGPGLVHLPGALQQRAGQVLGVRLHCALQWNNFEKSRVFFYC